MSEEESLPEENAAAPAAPEGVGAQLRAAREAKGLTLDQVAAETRISRHNLEHIEAGQFDALAGRTYAVGFAKTYAKTVGLHEGDVAEMVRAEMDIEPRHDRASAARPEGKFEPGDPARAPGGRLVWFSLFAVVLLLVGIFFAARVLFSPAAELPSLAEQERAEPEAELAAQREAAQEAEQSADPTGPVVFTAEDEAWVRFYDAEGRVLNEAIMQAGDTYQVPADANGPLLITGRPQMLEITIGGQAVPKLSYEQETLTDVPVSAEALLARENAEAPEDSGSPAQGPSPAPPTGASPPASPQPQTD